jgi:hypothetical protein
MIALISTELRRDWSRRAVHLFGLLAFAGIALGAVLVFLNSTKPGNGFSVIDIRDVFKGVSAPLTILGIASLSRNRPLLFSARSFTCSFWRTSSTPSSRNILAGSSPRMRGSSSTAPRR